MSYTLKLTYPDSSTKTVSVPTKEQALSEKFGFESISPEHEAVVQGGPDSMSIELLYVGAEKAKLRLGGTWSCDLDHNELYQLREQIDSILEMDNIDEFRLPEDFN